MLATTPPGARGLLAAIEVSWLNADSPGLVGVEIWGGRANNRDLARNLTTIPVLRGTLQQWEHQGLTTGETWWYWLRSVSGDGNVSAWTPEEVFAGWYATVVGMENNVYDIAYGEIVQELRWLLEQILIEIRTLREMTEHRREAEEVVDVR
jgi:predicted phage tail protein